jgi:flavin-dependent dehydrogenase
MTPSPCLTDGSRIAVVGGGPAGSFFALAALDVAAALGVRLDVTIFERKALTGRGQRDCNMCAGILSKRVMEGLAALGLSLPAEVIRGDIRFFQLYWGEHTFPVVPPESGRRVLAVYRGGGPSRSPFAPTPGFDAFLLGEASNRGCRIVREAVDEILFEPHPRIMTPQRSESFDMAVLATGVNARPPRFTNLDYRPPRTETMAQDELLLTKPGREQMEGAVHVYLDRPDGLTFGALVPKGQFATVSLLGQRLGLHTMRQFLALPEVAGIIRNTELHACGCRPRVGVSSASNFFADRFVAVGDSCVTRLYKDGIGSALMTSRAAAEAALRHGISRASFSEHYAPVCRRVLMDNRFGRMVFWLTSRTRRNRRFAHALARALESESVEAPSARMLNSTLWSLFTGDAGYARILRMMLLPRSFARLARGMAHGLIAGRIDLAADSRRHSSDEP